MPFLLLLTGCDNWPQWGQNPQHTGVSRAIGQPANRILADIVYDPFVAAEQAEQGGNLTVHYQAPLLDGGDMFMEFKTGTWVPCNPLGSGMPAPCGPDAWNSQVWNVRRFTWQNN